MSLKFDESKPLALGYHRGPVRAVFAHRRGRAVQVDPIKPTLKAPGIKRLKLYYDEPLSNLAFKINLRRYTVEAAAARRAEVHALVLLAGGLQLAVNTFLWDLLVGVGLSMTKNGSV